MRFAPAIRPIFRLAAVVVSILAGAPLAGAAPKPPADAAEAALTAAVADLARCPETPALAGRRLRVALVVYPDGVVTTALGPWEPPVDDAATASAVERCFDTALRTRTGALTPRAKAPRLLTRTVELPGAEARATAELDARLEQMKRDVAVCMGWPQDRSLAAIEGTLRIEVGPTGVAVTAIRADQRLVDCVRPHLAGLVAPGRALTVERTLRITRHPPAGMRRPAGNEGDICSWGGHQFSYDPTVFLPEPAPCKPGLRCCAGGGAAGSDSFCMRTASCPMYP